MKTILKLIGIVILLLLMAGAIVFFFFPQKLIDFTNSGYATAAQLERKVIDIDGYTVHFYESEAPNEKTPLVLFHGMGDDKNSFLQTAEKLSEHYHLILPDLAGHGENERKQGMDYSIDGQATFLHNLVNELGIENFNLIGNSMGGHTAAAYAIKYPDYVKNLVLLNAAGVKLDDHVVYTGFGKNIESEEEFDAVLDRVFYEKPSLPGPIKSLMIEQINNSKDFVDHTLVPAIKTGKYFNLKDEVSNITAPTLVLWGKHDQVVEMNVAEYYSDNIAVSELNLIENAAHSPQLEVPDIVADAIHDFISKPKTAMIKYTKTAHAAKVQYYRWYTFYERDFENVQRLEHQLEILDEDIIMKSAAGEMQGRANYPERLKVYKGWKNAHHVKNIDVQKSDDGRINLEADIIYQNLKPDGGNDSYALHYSTFLKERPDEQLPIFSEINIKPTGTIENPTFEDAYPTNRMLSLMHFWLLNMEELDGNVEPFIEILEPDFELNFSSSGAPITSIEALEKWLNGTPTQLKQSNHFPENFAVQELGNNEYEVTVDFVWRGVTKENKGLKATTTHKWLVKDNPNDRFAKIKNVNATQKVALGPL
ncbi:alpha/beta hydrolase [Dokdonia sinensis]|uniref:Alpha/beta hydrolase n=1 Tax=Dokdonia sinensis TaxID=2479847 RepID=A0A3M0GZV9_9FLAO|nr:alpha/beta hydrolase [Dokdonia sinensis]RMB62876.1 alpha/beta hydrolase [Dokdonia sinensis]